MKKIELFIIGKLIEFNYFAFSISIPNISFRPKYGDLDDNHIEFGVEANTKILFTDNGYSWDFYFVILGFGIVLERQWSY